MGVSEKDQGGLNGNAAPKGHPMHRKRHRMTFCVWNFLPGIKVDIIHSITYFINNLIWNLHLDLMLFFVCVPRKIDEQKEKLKKFS